MGIAANDFFLGMRNISLWSISNCNYIVIVYRLRIKEKLPLIAIRNISIGCGQRGAETKVRFESAHAHRSHRSNVILHNAKLAIVEIKTHERKIEGNEKSVNYYNLLDFHRCYAEATSALSVSVRIEQINEFPDARQCFAVHRLVLTWGARVRFIHIPNKFTCAQTRKKSGSQIWSSMK